MWFASALASGKTPSFISSGRRIRHPVFCSVETTRSKLETSRLLANDEPSCSLEHSGHSTVLRYGGCVLATVISAFIFARLHIVQLHASRHCGCISAQRRHYYTLPTPLEQTHMLAAQPVQTYKSHTGSDVVLLPADHAKRPATGIEAAVRTCSFGS